MIKLSLSDDIAVGDKVRYNVSEVSFNSMDDYTGEYHVDLVDVTGVEGIALEVRSAVCKVEFHDTSFLPIALRHDNIWFVKLDLLEKAT
jgi:hypothetical protein